MSDTLAFDFTAEMPKQSRGHGAGRPGVEWEKLLEPARQHPGKPGKIFEFTDITKDGKTVSGQAQAQSRATVIQSRLRASVPLEEWKFNTRNLPTGKTGLWVTFVRTLTIEEYEEVAKRRQERGDKIRAGRAAKSNGHDASVTSAAEKVAAARAAKVATPQSA